MFKIPPIIGLGLLQMFGVLFPMLLFHSLNTFNRKLFVCKKLQTVTCTFLCGLSIIICMTFPVAISKDFVVDFRFIPLIVAFIFGGFWSGLILTIIIIIDRMAIGGADLYVGELLLTIIFVVGYRILSTEYERWKPFISKSFPYILLTIMLVFFLIGAQQHHTMTFQELILWLSFSLLNYVTLWMMMYLQTTMKEMEKVSEKIIQFEKSHFVNELLISISQQMLLPLQSAKNMIQSIQAEQLTAGMTNELRSIERDLHFVVRSINHYLCLMDDPQAIRSEWNIVGHLEDIFRMMQSYANMKQVKLSYINTAQEEVSIKGDRSMISFALINIIKNAVDTCNPLGQVNISLHEMLQDIYIVIEDNSISLPDNLLKPRHLPYQILTKSGNEHESRLTSICKIAEFLGGRMEVKAMPNEGTSFSLYFPKWAF